MSYEPSDLSFGWFGTKVRFIQEAYNGKKKFFSGCLELQPDVVRKYKSTLKLSKLFNNFRKIYNFNYMEVFLKSYYSCTSTTAASV